MADDHRVLLRAMFDAAVGAAAPALCVPPHLPPPPKGRTIVVGAGKAAAAMAAAVEAHWRGPIEGLVVTRYGHGAPTRSIKVVDASHPVPDAAGPAAARAILDLVKRLTADDLVLCLISGGGSALARPSVISRVTEFCAYDPGRAGDQRGPPLPDPEVHHPAQGLARPWSRRAP